MLALPGFLLVRSINALLPVFGVTPEIIPVTEGYLNALSWGLPAVFGYLALRFFSEGLSLTRPNMYFTLLAIPLNIVGNYIFIRPLRISPDGGGRSRLGDHSGVVDDVPGNAAVHTEGEAFPGVSDCRPLPPALLAGH